MQTKNSARRIVATLIHRQRFARRLLRRAESEHWPVESLAICRGAWQEANNAAKLARQMLRQN